MIKRQNIRSKLLLINIAGTLISMLIAAVLWISFDIDNASTHFEQRFASQIEWVARNAAIAVSEQNVGEIRNLLSALQADPAILSAKILNSERTELASITFRSNDTGLTILSAKLSQNSGFQNTPIRLDDQIIGSLEIRYDTGEIQQTLAARLSFAFIVILLAIAIGSPLLFRLQGMITLPLKRLSELTQRVTQSKDYSLRGEEGYPDEVGQLTKNFNAMLDLIQQRDINLEETVRERTDQLAETNKALEHHISERKKSEQAQREFESRFEQAFLNAPIGMALVDRHQRIIRFNRSFEKFLERHNEERMYLRDFLSVRSFNIVSNSFGSLVREKKSFECEASCFSINGKPLSAVLSFSVVDYGDDNFQYAVLQVQDITESKRMSEKLAFQASHDVLTGLANRRRLKDELSTVSHDSEAYPFTLCIMDLDQFKIVNDTCGHMAGDELLRQVARILQDNVRPQDLVVRLGGDEFALLLQNCDRDRAAKVTEKVRETIEQFNFVWEGQTFRIGASIGVVIVSQKNVNFSELMQQADAACYVAKDQGRNRAHIIDDEDIEVSHRQGEMRWVQRIHDAIENNRFMLYTQVVIDLSGNQPRNRFEILLRLKDVETGNIIPPGAFMPAAERYSLMEKIDTWVVSALIAELQSNPGLRNNQQRYWVNLSGLSLGSKNFLQFLDRSIRECELPEGMINFEITETAVMRNVAEASKIMLSLKTLGCQFALDDFGSGMSSFGYLKNLPVDFIKIDGMFVRDIIKDEVDLIFVKSIIDIAASMNIKTVAEFVESEDVCETLRTLGADFGQGYHLGKPQPLLQSALAQNRSAFNQPEPMRASGT